MTNIVKWALLENMAIYFSISICVASGFYFMHSAIGMWSFILLLWLNTYKNKPNKETE